METLHGTAGTCRWTVRSFALLLLLPLLLLLIPPQTAAAVIFQDCAGVSDGALPAGWMNMPGTSGTASCSGGRIRVVDQDASRQTYCYYASAAFPESGPYTLDFDLLRVAGTARIALGTNSVQTTDFSGASLVQLIFTSDGSIDYFKGSTYHLKNGSAPAGQAVHVRLAGTYDASSQSANLYLDGVLVGTVDGYSWLSRKKSPNRLMLGSSGTTTTGDEFYVDNVRISQSVEPPASFVSSTVTTTAAGEPVSVVHVLSGGGADMDFTHRLYWYDPELDRFAKSYATPAGQADPSSWSVVVRRSGTTSCGRRHGSTGAPGWNAARRSSSRCPCGP